MKLILVVSAIFAVLPLFTGGYQTKEKYLNLFTSYKPTDEQITCIENRISKIIADNGNFHRWLKEAENTILRLLNEVKRCEAFSNPEQSKCFSKLESSSLSELGRLVDLITKDMVDIFDKVTDSIVECVSVITVKIPLDNKFNKTGKDLSTSDFEITNEQIKCIANVISIVIEHNHDLQWWFEEIARSILSLIAEATDCATYSGSERKICIVKLKVHVSVEVQRISELLPEDKQAITAVIKGFTQGCFPE